MEKKEKIFGFFTLMLNQIYGYRAVCVFIYVYGNIYKKTHISLGIFEIRSVQ